MSILLITDTQLGMALKNVNSKQWSPKILKHRYNCYLVPPYSEVAIENAICELTKNKSLRDKISKNARSTVLKYYNLDVASASLEKIVKKGL